MYFKKFAALAIAVVAAVTLMGSSASAAWVTTSVTFNGNAFSADLGATVGPPVDDVVRFTTGTGVAYTNTLGTGAGGTALVGDTVHTVTLAQVASGDLGTLDSIRLGTHPLFAVTTLVGKITGGNAATGFTVDWSQGVLTLLEGVVGQAFQTGNPATALNQNPIAQFVLGPDDTVFPGPFGQSVFVATPATQNNSSPRNNDPTQAQTNLLFVKPTVDPYAGKTEGGFPLGNQTLNNYAGSDGNPSHEGIFVATGQIATATPPARYPGDAAAVTALNTIFNNSLGINFATGAAPAGTAFNPAGGIATGDFFGNLTTDVYPITLQAVPEPSTFALLGMGVVGLGLARVRRKK